MNCTRCEGTGFINLHQVPDGELVAMDSDLVPLMLKWLKQHKGEPHDVSVCDCCGNGESWHGEPGAHNDWVTSKNPRGSEPFPECI